MNTLAANEGWRIRRRKVDFKKIISSVSAWASIGGKLLMLLLNDGQINSKVWDVVHFIESGN